MPRKSSNLVRIIAGRWRGRKLPVLDKQGLRPSTDRVRETLFNWLAFELAGTKCLDLFAGTGVLGFECLSRGAAELTFVEKDKEVSHQIELNAELLKADVNIATQDVLSYLSSNKSEQYNIVFVDPPYQLGLQTKVCEQLEESGWLGEGAYIYVEQSKQDELLVIPENWRLHRQGKTGQSIYSLYMRSQ